MESFLIDDIANYEFIWYQNTLFLICLLTHFGIFLFVIGLILCHKFIWEPSYNLNEEAPRTDPENNPETWINFYCDYEFYKVNEKIYNKKKLMESTKESRDGFNSEIENDDKKSGNLSMITKYNPNIKMDKSPVPSVTQPQKTDRVRVSNELTV